MDFSDIVRPEDINEKQLDFVYQSGVETLKTTLEAMKAISNRSIVLLSYISLVIGFCINNAFDKNISWFSLIMLVLFIMYYIGVFTYIVYFAKPRAANIAYDDPEDLLNKECIGEDEHILKYTICGVLQTKIDENRKEVFRMNAKFNHSINLAFLFMPVLFLWLGRKAIPFAKGYTFFSTL